MYRNFRCPICYNSGPYYGPAGGYMSNLLNGEALNFIYADDRPYHLAPHYGPCRECQRSLFGTYIRAGVYTCKRCGSQLCESHCLWP